MIGKVALRVTCLTGAAGVIVGTGVMLGLVGTAGADVVTPPGACSARGTFASTGVTDSSSEFVPSDIVKIPQSDTVHWEGNEKSYAVGSTGPSRAIDGAVTLTLPIGSATIWHWGGTSTRYANEGSETYNLPSIVDNVKLTLSGYQKDAGTTTCSGSIYVEVTASTFKSPLTYGSLAGIVVFSGLLLFAGKPVFKKNWAYDDIDG
jgi:hypothetical protein